MVSLTSTLSARVVLERRDDEVVVTIDGGRFASYSINPNRTRPFFRDVRAADGTLLSRPISPPGGDHAHHTGIWYAVDEINGIQFWHEQGQIKNRSVNFSGNGGDPAILDLRNDWHDPDGRIVLRERTSIRIFQHRLLSYDIVLTADTNDVTFGDTEEGFFAFRMAPSMCEEQTGRVVNAAGQRGAKNCWGKSSDWIDYCGEVDGKLFGVAMFDHPSNFRRSRYHVRDYGLLAISPFGEGGYTKGRLPARPVTLKAGSSLRLRYGIYFHDGDTQRGNVKETYRRYVAEAKLSQRIKGLPPMNDRSACAGVATLLFPLRWSLFYQQHVRLP